MTRHRFDSPGAVVDEMDNVYDLLTAAQAAHVEAAHSSVEQKARVKALEATLYGNTEGTVAERAASVQRSLEQSVEWAALNLAEATLAGCKVEYDYLDSRRSILQSVLKQFQHDSDADRFGRGRPQVVA